MQPDMMPNQAQSPKRLTLGKAVESALSASGMTQEQFCQLTSFDKSKTSRLINGKISADSATLDAILNVFPDRKVKYDIVCAYLNDVTSAEARKNFSVAPKSGVKTTQLDASGLTSEGAAALAYILDRATEGFEVEGIFIDFAKAIGFRSRKK